MATPQPSADAIAVLRSALKSQYHAALAMLRQAIEQCPEDLWVSRDYVNPFWRIAYHALYYAHLYIQPSVHEFTPWEYHQTSIQDMDDIPAPPEILHLIELPHRPPRTGEPYTKDQILTYWKICDDMVDSAVDRLDLLSGESGFSWYPTSKIEHQMVAVRHTQHHAAQLGERLRSAQDLGIDWVGRRRD